MSSPGYLAVGGVEIANNARTVGYLSRGLGGPWFQTVQSQVCPNLLQEAWPLPVCATADQADQFYANPLGTYRMAQTGAAPVQPTQARWFEAGYWGWAVGATNATSMALPSISGAAVGQRVRMEIDVLATGILTKQLGIYKAVTVGSANVGYSGAILNINGAGAWAINSSFRGPLGAGGLVATPTLPTPAAGKVWFEVIFTAAGFTATLYGSDPALLGASILGQLAYAWTLDGQPAGYNTVNAAGLSEQAVFSTATDIVIGCAQGALLDFTQAAISEIDVMSNFPCTQSALADLFPSDTLWPADDLYPGLYGEFHDPGTDNAPWIDVDRPEGLDYLGLLIDDIEGLDTTSDRSVDPAADGIGGILGPETLAARQLTVKGWLIASDCSAMEYARRWLAETLADSLCDGCDLSFVDVRTTCGDDPAGDFNTNRWRLYDCGLTGMQTDTSDQEMCCFVTPIQFTITAGDPYLYGPVVNVSGPLTLNPGASDTTPVSFETWLYGAGTPQCVAVADQGIGIDAAIFTFTGGATGIEAGLVYPSLGLYPSDNIWPDDCVIPADGVTQEVNDECPFAFTFSIGPGETFVVDNSRQLLVWTLADGTVMDGSPQLNLANGDVIQWIDTCDGVGITACAAAYAGCTCDDTATVQIQTQHRER